jgi:putative addiction module component (TIGR02574 family)
MTDLRERIDDLSPAEKLELLDVLWASLEADAQVLSDAQRAELDRRVALYQQHPSHVVPWEQVRSELSSGR